MRPKTFLFKKTAIFVFLSAVSFIIFSAATFFNSTNFLAQAQPMPPLPVSNCQIEAEVQNITVAPPYSNAVNIPATANYLVTLKITKLLNTSCFPTLQTAQTIEATYSYLEFRKSSVRKGIIITGNLSSSGAKYVLSNVSSNTPPIPLVTPQNYTISLKKGWNMMSIPVNSKTSRENYYRPQSPPFYQYNYIPVLTNQFTIQDIKGCNIKEIWEYQASNNKFIKPTYLNPLKGYWVLVENDCNGTISGYRYNQQATLYQGWNMFSSKYSWNEINIASPFSIQKSCIEKSKIFYFDTAQNKFIEISETSKLDDTKGYWIEVQKNCTINEFGFSNTQPPPLPPNSPTIDIKANNSDGPISVNYNSTVTISWSSSNTTSCSITPGNWTGISGTQTSAPLTANTTFTATCTSTAGTVSDSVVVNVSQPPVSAPSISQLSPTSGDIDTKVTITGSGFTPTGNTVKFGSGNILNLNSTNNGTKIEFNVPANLNTCATLDFSLADSLPECGSGSPAVTPGVYPVSVKNSNGLSNSLNFTVTANLGNALPFETLLKGATSISPERASYVIREPTEYEAMWFKHFGRVSRPFVDLGNKNMLIAVFAGNKSTGGYGIEVKNVYYDKTNFKLNVIVKEYSPASSCAVSQSQSQPYHIILLDKNYAAVSFSVEQEVIKCN